MSPPSNFLLSLNNLNGKFCGNLWMKLYRNFVCSECFDSIRQMHLLLVQLQAGLLLRCLCDLFGRNRSKNLTAFTSFDLYNNFLFLYGLGKFLCILQILCSDFICMLVLQLQII